MAYVNYRWADMTPTETMAQQMQGYRPDGRTPSAPTDYSQFYEDELNGLEKQRATESEIAQLETELAQVEAQIAEFDRENPGIASGDIGVAASLMEAGNIAPYQQMVGAAQAREQMGSSRAKNAEESIWNGIDNASKLAYNLDNTMDDTRGARIVNIRAELDKAARTAREAGVELPRKWYELDKMISGDGVSDNEFGNVEVIRNNLEKKLSEGNLHDSDITTLEKWANENTTKENSEKVRALVKGYKEKTIEAKGRRDKAIKDAEVAAKNFVTKTQNMTEAERNEAFNTAVRNGEKWTIFYTMNNGRLTVKPR